MPQRIELTEFGSGAIGGIPFAVASAWNGRLVAFVATIDGDGLMETAEECLAAARMYRRRVDISRRRAQDGGGGELPGH